jgi:hypothetical protein
MRRRPCIFCSILRPCAHWSRAYDWASTRGKHGDMIYGAKRLRWANATLADVFHKNTQPNTGSFGHFPCQVPSQASTSWEEEVCLCNKSIHHNSSPFAKWTCSQAMWPKNLYIWLVIGYGDYTTSHTGITIIHCGNPYELHNEYNGLWTLCGNQSQARKVALRGKDDASPFIVEELYAAWAGWHVAVAISRCYILPWYNVKVSGQCSDCNPSSFSSIFTWVYLFEWYYFHIYIMQYLFSFKFLLH